MDTRWKATYRSRKRCVQCLMFNISICIQLPHGSNQYCFVFQYRISVKLMGVRRGARVIMKQESVAVQMMVNCTTITVQIMQLKEVSTY